MIRYESTSPVRVAADTADANPLRIVVAAIFAGTLATAAAMAYALLNA